MANNNMHIHTASAAMSHCTTSLTNYNKIAYIYLLKLPVQFIELIVWVFIQIEIEKCDAAIAFVAGISSDLH